MYWLILLSLLFWLNPCPGQAGDELLNQVRQKMEKVNDYKATGKLKTDVAFIKAPVSAISVYYKKPDKMKIVNESGFSLVPKGSVNISLNKFLSDAGSCQVIDAGIEKETGFRMLKLLPVDENADVVLSTLYIDEKNLLIRKAKNTTRENGTYELELTYDAYAAFGLPDKVIFTFNTKEYKLPKGITFEYENGADAKKQDNLKQKKGRVEISYSAYTINKGIDDAVFNKE